MGQGGMPRFAGDGTFRVMQVADVQESSQVRVETLELLSRALDRARPDLVVLTGDQIKGYNPVMLLCGESAVAPTIRDFMRPVVERGIPFAVTYGNHDDQAGVSNARQDELYGALPGCLNTTFGRAGREPGTFCVPVMSSDGRDVAMAVWLAYSGGDAPGGGYEAFDPETTAWLVREADALSERAGHRVPGILFQHIPMPDVYDCLVPAEPGADGVPGYRGRYRHGHRLRLDEGRRLQGRLLEKVGCPDEDTGELDALLAQGDFFAAFFGHDHKNSFVVRHRGMLLGYAPTASFSSYGPGLDRAVRVFEFDEADPTRPETYLLTYRELVGETTTRPLRDWARATFPTTLEHAGDWITRLRWRGAGTGAPGTAAGADALTG